MTRYMGRHRSAFTLIEMLVVIFLMSIILTLAVIMLPNLNRNKGVPNAANQLEGWVRLSKGQALRDGAPRGIRLIPDPNNPTQVTSLQYIEQPEPISPRGQWIRATLTTTPNPFGTSPPPMQPPYPNPGPTIVTLQNVDPTNPASPTPVFWDGVAAGDFFELTVAPYGIYRITSVAGALLQLDFGKSVDGTDLSTLTLADGFRVIRAPRPLVGEPLLQMHKDVYIDLSTSQLSSPDILFSSTGQVAYAPQGHIFLVVQHAERPNDKLIVVIYTRTGKVTAVNWYDTGPDPYAFARDGRGAGL